MSRRTVLVLGDVMRDVVVRLDGPIRRGTDRRAAITTMPGGSAANLAAWLAHGGTSVRLLACVGASDLDAERRRLSALRIEPVLMGHPTLPTGTLVALVDPDGERSFLTDRGANDALEEADLPATLLDDVAHLHVSGYAFVGSGTRAVACGLIPRAHAAGIPVSLDPGSAGFIADLGAEAMLRWSAGVTLCVANAAEAVALAGATDAAIERLCERFPLVVVKRGAAGAVARHRDGRSWEASAPAVAVRDTIGAGDAFLAGFLAARLAGEPVEACLVRAVAQGSLAVTLAAGAPPSEG